MSVLPIPEALLDNLQPEELAALQVWWNSRSDDERADLTACWDERGDTCSHSFSGDEEAPSWHTLPIIVTGRFVPKEESRIPGEWRQDYFEYLLKNPELLMNEVLPRVFLVACTAHAAARDVLQAGRIPSDFACPFTKVECPMRRLLDRAPGRDIQLGVVGGGSENRR